VWNHISRTHTLMLIHTHTHTHARCSFPADFLSFAMSLFLFFSRVLMVRVGISMFTYYYRIYNFKTCMHVIYDGRAPDGTLLVEYQGRRNDVFGASQMQYKMQPVSCCFLPFILRFFSLLLLARAEMSGTKSSLPFCTYFSFILNLSFVLFCDRFRMRMRNKHTSLAHVVSRSFIHSFICLGRSEVNSHGFRFSIIIIIYFLFFWNWIWIRSNL